MTKPRRFIEPLGGQPLTGPIRFGTGRPGLYIAAAVLDAWRERLQECRDAGQVTEDVLDELGELFKSHE